MTKEEQVLALIESEIISSKLILTLNSIGVDAGDYFTDVSRVVFAMLSIEETEEIRGKYFDLIVQIEYLELRQRNELAQKCYNFLVTKSLTTTG